MSLVRSSLRLSKRISLYMTLAHGSTVWGEDYSSPPMIWNIMTNHRTENWIEIGYKRLHDTITGWIWHLSLSWLEFLESCQVLISELSLFRVHLPPTVDWALCQDVWTHSDLQMNNLEVYCILTELIQEVCLRNCSLCCYCQHCLIVACCENIDRLYQICSHQTDRTSYISTVPNLCSKVPCSVASASPFQYGDSETRHWNWNHCRNWHTVELCLANLNEVKQEVNLNESTAVVA